MAENTVDQAYAAAQANASAGASANSFIGGLIGQDAVQQQTQDLLMMRYANEFNSAESQKQRDFEKMMSDTQYSRAAKDLSTLGFSPMALLSNASSASTPSGSAASSVGSPGAKGSSSSNIIGGLLSALAMAGITSANIVSKRALATASDVAKTAIADKNNAVKMKIAKDSETLKRELAAAGSTTYIKNKAGKVYKTIQKTL